MINPKVYSHMNELINHKKLCEQLIRFFLDSSEIIAAFISGSGVSGAMDKYSDLDLGFVCKDNLAKDQMWKNRLNWKLPEWFHRMDADHVKPYFIIYLFEPHIHVDLAFYTLDNLPSQAGGPFTIAFDKNLQLENWIAKVNRPYKVEPDWSNVVHEEERFWTWTHYSWCHSGRGEYYDDASTFDIMRGVIQKWHSRLNGNENFNTRRLEQKGEIEFIKSMMPCFPKPNRQEMKLALLNLINLHNKQRVKVEKLIRPQWTTSQYTRDKITQLVRDM